jgi:hypothetical protein
MPIDENEPGSGKGGQSWIIDPPRQPPEGYAQHEGYWIRQHGQKESHWHLFSDDWAGAFACTECFPGPSSSRAMTSTYVDTPAPPVPGGGRAWNAGFRLGRILGHGLLTVVKGLGMTRGLAKKQALDVEKNDGRGYMGWSENEDWYDEGKWE